MIPRVSIVILNWNGWEDTIECLESVYQIEYSNFDVLLVDNHSEDDSLEQIRAYCSGKLEVKSDFFDYNSDNKPLKVEEHGDDEGLQNVDKSDLIIIKNDENYGFPGGNNVGIRFALDNLNPHYVLLLNNDTVVDKKFLNELVNNGESNKKIGIIGPKIYYYNEADVIWSAGCRISWKLARGIQIGSGELDQGQYDDERKVEYISGSAFLIKKEVIRKIGLMDENYFYILKKNRIFMRNGLKRVIIGFLCAMRFYVPLYYQYL
ncbi:MAG: glycosyltransferase family 2 protein [Methanobacteriaceae archaeon]|nr:glycosyltransferase family 2 protein [Methanobacteriaceae archaeon]